MIPIKFRLPLLLIIVIVPTLIIYVLFKFNFFTSAPTTSSMGEETVTISSPSPSPTPSPRYLEKELLKVHIYNGTGVIGQAGKVGDAFAAIGFRNIITANTTRRTDEAEVRYSKNVSPDVRSEVYKTLGDIFITVATIDTEPKNGFDIEIITGR